MPYYPPAASAGVTSPVATDPLTFSGAVTFSKHVEIDNDDAASKTLIVKGFAAQSVAIQEWQTSAGAGTGITVASSATQLTFPTGTTNAVGLSWAGDTFLFRSASATLKTAATFQPAALIVSSGASTQIRMAGDNSVASIYLGNSLDTFIYRVAAGVLGVSKAAPSLTAPTMTGAGLMIQNLSAAPSTNPVGGGVIYCEAGALKYIGTSGTITTIGPA